MIKFWNELDAGMDSMCVKCGRGVKVTVTKGVKTRRENWTTARKLMEHHCSPGDRRYFEDRRIAIKSRDAIEEAKLWHYAQPPDKYFATYARGFQDHYELNEGNTKPLEIRCPECGQPAGARCRNKGIKSRVVYNSTFHMPRIMTWIRARGLKLDNGYIVPRFRIPPKQRP